MSGTIIIRIENSANLMLEGQNLTTALAILQLVWVAFTPEKTILILSQGFAQDNIQNTLDSK